MKRIYYTSATFKAAFVVLIFAFIVMGCRRNSPLTDTPLQVEEIANTNDPSQPVITIPADNTLQPTRSLFDFEFDWEHAQNMPAQPGKPVIPVPWSDQAIRNYDPGLRYDFKKSDGWELVNNNYSDSITWDRSFFILYNKFRGLLRYYCYNPVPGSPSLDGHRSLVNEIELEGKSSPIFNYADQFIVDINSNSRSASLIEPWAISQGGWYISQFEMAYDRNIAGYNYSQIGLSWSMAFAKTELLLNNIPAANKMIFLQKPGLRFTTTPGSSTAGNMQVHVKSVNGFNELAGIFPGAVVDKLLQTVYDSTAGNKLNATLVRGLGIADCKLDVTALFKQDYGLGGLVLGLSFVIPGMDHSKTIGGGPLFNEPMGVFYLASKPVIRHSNSTGSLTEQYTLDVSSVEYVINPFIQKYADVRNFRQEIVAIDTKETSNLTEAKIYQGKILKASAPLNLLGVRVSFDVVPKNGSDSVKIIKTFKADLQNN